MRFLHGFIVAVISTAFAAAPAAASGLSPLEKLGKALFFDTQLSNPPGMSCASCHDPGTGWTGPDARINAAGAVMEGAVHTRFGSRKPPTSAYAGFNPLFHACGNMMGEGAGSGGMGGAGRMGGGMMCQDGFVGGMFWDGRATGWTLGDPLAEQAQGPFLNPLEMNNPNAKLVCIKVRESAYAGLFEEAWGEGTLDCVRNTGLAYERIARSIAAYERSSEVNPFSSKFDAFWRNREQARSEGRQIPPVHAINMMNRARFAGLGLSDMELMGLMVFNTKGKCSVCHLLQPMHGSEHPLFTDFRYHNLGIPKNPENPYYSMPQPWNPDGTAWSDAGLGAFLDITRTLAYDYSAYAEENYGKHRTPTLRNVDKRPSPEFVKAFGHNGYFKDLMLIVHFYNCRDVPFTASCSMLPPFPEPEEARNMNTTDMGDLGLTPQEGMSLVAFLKTLTDGYEP